MHPASKRVLAALLLVFAVSNIVNTLYSNYKPKREYFLSLTFATLVFTCFSALVDAGPTVSVSALVLNALVCGLYYTTVNRGSVTGQSAMLHGGTAAILLVISSSRDLTPPSPLAAAILTGSLLAINSAMQWQYERLSKTNIYPTALLTHPLWRLLVLPVIGAAMAAYVAAVPAAEVST